MSRIADALLNDREALAELQRLREQRETWETWRALPDGVVRACYTIGTADGEITSACLFDEADAARWAAKAYETWDDTYYLTSTNFTAEAARQFVREYRQSGPRMRVGTVVRIR